MGERSYVLGIDIGATDIKYGVLEVGGEIRKKSKMATEAERGAEAVSGEIAKSSKEMLRECSIGEHDLVAVGVGCPGLINSADGIVREPPNLAGWKDVPLRDLLGRHFECGVFVNNDANAAAYGEFWMGAGREVNTMVMFTLGTGIGGGIILEGKMYTGVDGTAGEVGHVIIDPDGPECGCGKRGCLEALASAPAVVRRVREALEIDAGIKTGLREVASSELTSKKVHEYALGGDKFAAEVLAETGRILGIGAANMINLLNPEMIVYSGAMINAGEYIFGPLRASAEANSFKVPWKRVKIGLATLGADAGLVGAAGLALAGAKEGEKEKR